MTETLKKVTEHYKIQDKITVLCGDTTNFNPSFARDNKWEFDPCKNHQLS